jgi:hypothetical protein
MDVTPRFIGRVDEQGRLRVSDRRRLDQYLRTLAGKAVEIVVRRQRKPVSNQQHRYYRGVVLVVFAEFLGYECDELHDALAWRFLVIDPDAALPRKRSTADLSTSEMTNYIEQVRRLAGEMACYIPDPNECEVAA